LCKQELYNAIHKNNLTRRAKVVYSAIAEGFKDQMKKTPTIRLALLQSHSCVPAAPSHGHFISTSESAPDEPMIHAYSGAAVNPTTNKSESLYRAKASKMSMMAMLPRRFGHGDR
jgi:hypothetical protein